MKKILEVLKSLGYQQLQPQGISDDESLMWESKEREAIKTWFLLEHEIIIRTEGSDAQIIDLCVYGVIGEYYQNASYLTTIKHDNCSYFTPAYRNSYGESFDESADGGTAY